MKDKEQVVGEAKDAELEGTTCGKSGGHSEEA